MLSPKTIALSLVALVMIIVAVLGFSYHANYSSWSDSCHSEQGHVQYMHRTRICVSNTSGKVLNLR